MDKNIRIGSSQRKANQMTQTRMESCVISLVTIETQIKMHRNARKRAEMWGKEQRLLQSSAPPDLNQEKGCSRKQGLLRESAHERWSQSQGGKKGLLTESK